MEPHGACKILWMLANLPRIDGFRRLIEYGTTYFATQLAYVMYGFLNLKYILR